LSECLVEDDGGGGGEVEAPLAGDHGDGVEVVGVLLPEVGWEAVGFGSEDEEGIGRVGGGGVVFFGVAGEEEVGGGEVEGVGELELDFIPVVEAGSFHAAVGDGEAERADEEEAGVGGGAGAGDVARVLGNLRLEEDDFHERGARTGLAGCLRLGMS